jgi:hypothetical protein
MKKIVVKPLKKVIRDPDTFEQLPDKWTEKKWSSYWQRRYMCGDVDLREVGSKKSHPKQIEKKVEG